MPIGSMFIEVLKRATETSAQQITSIVLETLEPSLSGPLPYVRSGHSRRHSAGSEDDREVHVNCFFLSAPHRSENN